TATVAGQTGTVTASLGVTVVPVGANPPPIPPAGATGAQTNASPKAASAPPPHTTAPPLPSPAPPPKPSPATTRQAVYELYRSANYDWFYTSSATERSSSITDGYKSEGTSGIGFYGCRGAGTVTVYRLYNATKKIHLFTASASEEKADVSKDGFKRETSNFSGCDSSKVPGVLPVYRLTYKGASFLTVSAKGLAAAEKDGWSYQGIAFDAFPPPGYSG
ncbi:MAG: hypothetical protein ACRDJU_13555, partial [Actinomycetota bacterium]